MRRLDPGDAEGALVSANFNPVTLRPDPCRPRRIVNRIPILAGLILRADRHPGPLMTVLYFERWLTLMTSVVIPTTRSYDIDVCAMRTMC